MRSHQRACRARCLRSKAQRRSRMQPEEGPCSPSTALTATAAATRRIEHILFAFPFRDNSNLYSTIGTSEIMSMPAGAADLGGPLRYEPEEAAHGSRSCGRLIHLAARRRALVERDVSTRSKANAHPNGEASRH